MSGSNNDVFISETLTNAVFDGPFLYNTSVSVPITLSGVFTTEFTPDGTLVNVTGVSFHASSSDPSTYPSDLTLSSFTVGVPGGSGGSEINELNVQANGGNFYQGYLDFVGETPASLSSGDGGHTSAIADGSNYLEALAGGSLSNNGVITGTAQFDVDTYVSTTLSNAVFDGPYLYSSASSTPITVSGTYITEYNPGGTLIGVSDLALTATSSDPTAYPSDLTLSSFTAGTPGGSGGNEINEIQVNSSDGGNFYLAYLDFVGENPATLTPSDGSHTSAIADGSNYLEALAGGSLSDFGTISGTALDTFIYSTISNLIFDNDGLPETISGTFEAEYTPGGTLVAISNVSLLETGTNTGTLTNIGAITAGNPTVGGYGALNQLTFYGPTTLYIDYYGEQPDAIFSGTNGNEYSSVNLSPGEYEQIGAAGNAGTVTDVQVAPGFEPATCYLRGTKLLTPAGEVPVENLNIGDTLITRFGGYQRIKWIGRQSYARPFIRHNREKLPVRITAGALGNNLPKRDLLVSPGHSMLIGGMLILAKNLVNGLTITQTDAPEQIDYFQPEFENHDCVMAEGTWSESYADTPGLRAQFHNAAEFYELFPNHQPIAEQRLCAPRPQEGRLLDAALRPIIARAQTGTAPGPLRGYIDALSESGLEGWAQDLQHPELPVLLEILIAGRPYATFLACDYRADLAAAGIGRGFAKFACPLPAGATLADVRVRRLADGAEIYPPHEAIRRSA